jgi:hypothetical protein
MAHPYDDYEAFRGGENRGDRDRWDRDRWDRDRWERDRGRSDSWERPGGRYAQRPWREEERYRGRDEYSRAPGPRDARAARDAMEGGDLGWHGGVRGAEGGSGYGRGFFGTAYSLYAGRPEREEGRVGRGPKGYRRSDERIHDEVCERIARSGVNADDVEVKVENGEVTLTGTVERREDRWHLESLCDSVFGVDDVHDHLRTSDRQRRWSETDRTH